MPTYKNTILERIEVKECAPDVPLILDDWTLSFRLGFTGKTLWYILKNRSNLYREFLIPKKSGGMRRTFDPKPMVRVLQKQLRARILFPLVSKLGPHVTAYQVGKSTVDAVAYHLRPCEICDATTRPGTNPVRHACPRRGVKFKLDLKDFFLSTRRSWIRQYFHEVIGYNHYVSSLLGQLLTTPYQDERRRQRNGVPPGALTAGDICNLVCDWRLDQPLLRFLGSLPHSWKYTRYADDLYFSSDTVISTKEVNEIIRQVADVIQVSGYRVNWKKKQVQYWSQPQRILGINLNRKLNIPAREYRKMHMILYKAKANGFNAQLKWAKKDNVGALHSWITGKLNYFKQFAPEKTEKLRQLYHEALNSEINKSEAIARCSHE